MVAKNDRAAINEAKIKFNENWTKKTIEEVGEELHESIRKRGSILNQILYLDR